MVRLSGGAVTIIGVGPEGYRGEVPGLDTDFWLSISASGPVGGDYYWNTLERRQDHWFSVIARLQSGVTAEQAQAAMDILANRLATEYPQLNEGRDITVFPSAKVRVHPEQDAFLFPTAAALMSVVGLVLLIACSNLANLLLARASARGREVAVRQAMGATRGRLVRHLLTESVVLAVVGGVVGLIFAIWAGRALAVFQPSLPIPLSLEVSFHWRVLVFALGLSVLTGLVFGLAPALMASRPNLVPSLKDSVDSVSFTGRQKHFRWFGLKNLLVTIQVAVSFVLLVGAGLLIRSLVNAETVDLGFRNEGLAILQADAAEGGYKGEDSLRLFQSFHERVSGLPGVEQVAMTTRLPVSPKGGSSTLEIEGYEPPTGTGHVEVNFAYVDSDYFDTLRIPLRHGRTFTSTDRIDTERVTVVNEAFARNFWGASDAVGRRYRHQGYPDSWVRIVGVVGDAKVQTPDESPTPIFFRPLSQSSGYSRLFVVARTASDPAVTVGMMRQELRTIDSDVPVYQAGTMDDHVSAALALPRTAAGTLGLFGGLALLLAAMGLYAVVAFAVSRRTTEIGIRMALGASGSRVVATIAKDTLVVVGAGVVLGLVLSFMAAPVLESLLFNVPTTDLVTLAIVALFMALVAGFAAYLPARRAAHTDPMRALRFE
jgi:predicted permease